MWTTNNVQLLTSVTGSMCPCDKPFIILNTKKTSLEVSGKLIHIYMITYESCNVTKMLSIVDS